MEDGPFFGMEERVVVQEQDSCFLRKACPWSGEMGIKICFLGSQKRVVLQEQEGMWSVE